MKRGITAATIAIMITVLFILLGTISVSSYNSIQNAKKIVFALEISNIQEEVDSYIQNSNDNDYPISGDVFTLDLSNVTDSAMTQFDGEIVDENNQITLYELDLTAIGIDDTEYGNKKSDKDIYVLSKDTGKVYYLNGVKYGSMTYYTLTDELIDIKERNENEVSDETYEAPTITTTAFTVNKDTSNNKKIYLTNIKAESEEPTIIKYEREMIEEDMAYEYFQNNGQTLVGDRIEVEEGEYVTLYAESSSGKWSIRYEGMCTIPDGFYYVGGSIPTGLVISDSVSDANKGTQTDGDVVSAGLDGNQFVWIPVDDIKDFVRRDGYIRNGWIQTVVSGGVTSEPYDGEGLSLENDLTGEYAEYAEMRVSVEEHKGFYIARYEAGDGEATSPRTTPTVAHEVVSKKNAYVYNFVPWGKSMTSVENFTLNGVSDVRGAVMLSRDMYNESTSVTSTLCYGVQWDAIMSFVKNIINPYASGKQYIRDSSGMGWYSDNYADGNPDHLTGIDMANSENKVNNIYDLAGNVTELLMENMDDSDTNIRYRTHRGGHFKLSGSECTASTRNISAVTSAGGGISFRVALYLK